MIFDWVKWKLDRHDTGVFGKAQWSTIVCGRCGMVLRYHGYLTEVGIAEKFLGDCIYV